jgi:hypothetical protein
VLRHLAETGALVHRDGRWTSDLRPEDASIPEGVREVVGRRLTRLGDEVEGVLRFAAVIGYEFDVTLLTEVLERPADDVLDALEAAAAANLAQEIGIDRYRFAHALVRETLYAELSATRRARQHRKVAEALEVRHARGTGAVLQELARHWGEAVAGGDPARAIELAVAAGEAELRGAPETAAGWFVRALDMMEGEDAFVALQRSTLVQLAEAQMRSGDAEGSATARTAARLAIDAGDVSVAREALLRNPRFSFNQLDEPDPEKVALLREALAGLELAPAGRAFLLGELATELIFERDRAGRQAALDEQEALLPLLSEHDRGLLALQPGGRFVMLLDRSDLMRRFDQIVTFAEHESDARTVYRALIFVQFMALVLGDRDAVCRARERRRAIEGDAVDPWRQANQLMFEGVWPTIDGDLDEADAVPDRVRKAFLAIDRPEGMVYFGTTSFCILRERGLLSLALDGFAEAAAREHPGGAANAATAFIQMVSGDRDGAAAALARVDVEDMIDDAGYSMAIALWSEVAAGVGSVEQCDIFAGLLAPGAGIHLTTGGMYLGACNRLLALLHDRLGGHDVADAAFAAAVAEHERLGSPTWVARTQLDWAESLIARGERKRAEASLAAAESAIGDRALTESLQRLAALRAATRA